MKERSQERGFSLMEVTVALMVLTVVMGITFSLLTRFQQSYRYSEAYADAQRNARFAMARLNEIMRSAGTNPTALSTVNSTDFAVLLPPTTVTGTAKSSASLQLRSDLNGDQLNNTWVENDTDVIVTSENVTIRLDQATRRLMLDDNTRTPVSSFPIADSIIAIRFTDPNGSANTNKAIEVQLVAVPNGIQRGDPRYVEVSYTAMVRLRNR